VNYAIFFAGSGQQASDSKYVYKDWATKLQHAGYETLLCDGVGEFGASTVTKRLKNMLGAKALTGAGWAKIIQFAMGWLEGKAAVAGDPEHVVVVGMSRGGVEAVICANCLNTRFQSTPVFVFAIDPVQGYHATNDGSFDMRDRQNTVLGQYPNILEWINHNRNAGF
jgi:hypothetical protein